VKKLLFSIALLSFSSASFGSTDGQLWLSANARYKPHKTLRLEITQHLRLSNNLSQVEKVMPELEMQYRPIKPLSVSIGYRYISERTKNNDFEPAHRYHAQLSSKKDIGPLELSYRLRYQEKHEEDEFDFNQRLRNKVKLTLDTDTPYTPFVFTEIFTDPTATPIDNSKYRLGFGAQYKIDKRQSVSLDYLYQNEFERNDLQQHILRFNYQYKIEKKKKENQIN
jgi:hypothetical protein